MDVDIDQPMQIVCIDDKEGDDSLGRLPNCLPNLPKVSFRHLPTPQKRPKKARPVSYYHYEEPSSEELFERVEYDMDLEDLHWLKNFNKDNKFAISEAEFERIMDRLEKESYLESDRGSGLVVDEDAVCAICDDGECSNANVILFCDLCDLAVHQDCYGVPYIPEGQWLCRRCLKSPMRNVECCLCPNLGGAFKQTDDNRWAHVICALWIPEVCFANTVFLEPIDNINQIPTARWKLRCYICKEEKRGACIQCHKPSCYRSFHVTCCRQAGLYMKISSCKYPSADGGSYMDVKKEAFCHRHTPPGGGGMYDEDAKKEIRKTRKRLAVQRREFQAQDTAVVKVDEDKLMKMTSIIGHRGRSKHRDIKLDCIKRIHNYWQLKRHARSGVPLLRRLQLSFNGNTRRPASVDLDVDKYTRLRYDLEKCRLLIGEVKKREVVKTRLVKMSREIIDLKLRTIDLDYPPGNGAALENGEKIYT